MKRLAVVLVIVALTSANLYSQGLSFGGGPHAGIAFSSFKKPAGDLYGTGLLFGGHGELSLTKNITLRLSFDYATFSADKDKLKGVAQDATIKAIEDFLGGPLSAQDIATVKGAIKSADGAVAGAPSIFAAGLWKIPTGGMVTPYGLLGLGITFLSFGDVNFESTALSATNNQNQTKQFLKAGTNSSSIDSETKFGLQFGGGSEFRLSKLMKLIFEVKYCMIFTSDGTTSYFPIVVGATFGD